MKITTTNAIKTALRRWQFKNGDFFPDILLYTIYDTMEYLPHVNVTIDDDPDENYDDDDLMACANEVVRQLEVHYIYEWIESLYFTSGIEVDDKHILQCASVEHLSDYSNEDRMRDSFSGIVWNDCDDQERKRVQSLADMAISILSDMTGIHEEGDLFLSIMGTSYKSFISYLHLDDLDYLYTHGFLPYEKGEKPQFPFHYPSKELIEQDIKRQIESSDVVQIVKKEWERIIDDK